MAKTYVWRNKGYDFGQTKTPGMRFEVRAGSPEIQKMKTGDRVAFDEFGSETYVIGKVTCYDSIKRMLMAEGVRRVAPDLLFDQALYKFREIFPPKTEREGIYVLELRRVPNNGENQVYLQASTLLRQGNEGHFTKVISEGLITSLKAYAAPGYVEKYFCEYVPKIFSGTSDVLTCYVSGKIAAVTVMSKDPKGDASKSEIAVLHVKKDYYGQGILGEMLNRAYEWLGTTTPKIVKKHTDMNSEC